MFCFQDPEDYRRLRKFFESVGFTAEGVLEALNIKDVASIRGDDIARLLRRTDRGTPLDILIRLFLIEVPCDVTAVEKAIEPLKLTSLEQVGLIQINGPQVSAAVKLLPYQNLILAFDSPCMLQTDQAENYVMGVGRSTLTLANLTIRRHSRLTLDLGSGCGTQALLAAEHSDRVSAVDRNPRAVQLTNFNAKLNAMSHVAAFEGNLFEPVHGQTFDLVITNPPFVISPEMRYIYRDGGMQADQICRKIAHEVPSFLNEGGFCQILCNWVENSGQNWYERLAKWFDGTGCDVWVIRSETLDAETYAATWIRHTEQAEPDRFAGRFEEWMAYYAAEGIHTIGAGLITMRRTSGRSNWFRADDAPNKMLGPCGEYILQGFELKDFLESIKDDKDLMNIKLGVSPNLCMDRQLVPSNQGWKETATQLKLTRGLAYVGNIDPYVANMIICCDGQRPLRDLLSEMARSMGHDPENIAPTFYKVVRGLIERGFLLPTWLQKD